MKANHTKIAKNQPKNIFFKKKMFEKSILTFVFLFFAVCTKAQSSLDFTILADKAFQKLYQNPDDCINYSTSILISDQNIEHKIILRNIISQAYAMKGDYVQSINISSQQEESEKADLSHFMQIFGEYNLADQYQNLDLYSQSEKIMSHILSDKKLLKTEDPKTKITIAKLYQLQALNFGINKNHSAALENLNKSDQYIHQFNEENKIVSIENNIFRSSYLLRQNKHEVSKKLIENTISKLNKKSGQPFLLALAHENLARYYFTKGNYQKAVEKLEKGLSFIETLPFNTLKTKIYEALSKNYFALHNDQKYHEFNKLYTESRAKIDSNTKEGIRYIVKLVETSQNKNLEFQKQNESRQLWIWALAFLLFIVVLMIYFFSLKSKNKELKKQFDFFDKQKKKEKINLSPHVTSEEEIPAVDKNTDKDSGKISKEKENEILQKLEEWEESGQYLVKSMSLSMLSAQMCVNTKYLSEVINNSKGKNFNGYINELRINHIAHLLKTDATYLNYKVSYLAEYSGFSSHSAFTTIFKSVTGMSPNVYIQEISQNKTS